MIPQISQAPGVVQLVLNFLQVLEQQGFTGDTATSYADRLTMATDNSVYQLLPDAVIFPRSTADVALLARVAAEPRFKSLIFTPRGGGTGTNGQALNGGIIVDMSRYMNRIIEINPEEGWVRVEAGVIKDQLNQFLKPYGYFFAPELSTSNRATLGGMINTDASGQGSLVYGKTSDHVLGLRAVLMGGDILDTQAVPVALAETLGNTPSTVGRIYNTVYQRCKAQRDLIIDKFPKLNRFLTGYDLRHVFNDEMSEFDLTRILTGSEGTLAFITEARLDITRLPKVRRLVNVKYDSFDSALRNAPFMVEAKALSVETVDSKVLNLAREDIVWHSVSELITDVPDKEMLGLNIVEFAGDDAALIDQQGDALSALGTSLSLALGSALIVGALGLLAAWLVMVQKIKGRGMVDALSLMPAALPGVVVGVGLILLWNQPFWPRSPYNTLWMLLLSYCCLLLPWPVRYVGSALRQLGPNLEPAARVHGASPLQALRLIVLPLVFPALLAAMLMVFAVASRELVTSLLLSPAGTQTVAVFIWRQFEQGSVGQGMAMASLTLLTGLVLMLTALALMQRRTCG